MLQALLFFQAPQPGGSWGLPLLLGGMFLVMYLFMIRPQQKKQKLATKFQDEMGKGDKIVTIAGIHGTINKVNEDGTIQLEISPGTYLRLEKSAISMEWTAKINKNAAAITTDKK